MNKTIIESKILSTVALPFVTLSYAQTLNGTIAFWDKRPMTLSCIESQTMTHQLRTENEAILVGIGTILSDNPRLNVRLVEGKSPIPIVLDRFLRIPLDSKVLQGNPILFCSSQCVQVNKKKLEEKGAQIVSVKEKNEQLDLLEVLVELKRRGIQNVMVEVCSNDLSSSIDILKGGSEIIKSFLLNQYVHKCVLTISPSYQNGLHLNLERMLLFCFVTVFLRKRTSSGLDS